MKPQLHLAIPTPCHENWDAMTPNNQGKFCLSCSKSVVDFTTMGDQEIINYFKKYSENTCGRFNDKQLNRALIENKIEKQHSLKWLVATMLSLAVITKVKAQNRLQEKVKLAIEKKEANKPEVVGNVKQNTPKDCEKKPILPFSELIAGKIPQKTKTTTGDTIITYKQPLHEILNKEVQPREDLKIEPNKLEQEIINVRMGGVMSGSYVNQVNYFQPRPRVILNGILVDENNQPIPYASIQIKNKNGTTTAIDGSFSLEINRLKNNLTIEVSSLSYEPKMIVLNKHSNPNIGVITLQNKPQNLNEVVVSSGYTVVKGTVVRSATTIKRQKQMIDSLQKIKLLAKSFCGIEAFKIFPNPAKTAEVVHIEPKETGAFIVQIYDAASKLLSTHRIVYNKDQASPIKLPNTAQGILYIRLINEKLHKTYINKIVVTK